MRTMLILAALLLVAPCYGNDVSDAFGGLIRRPTPVADPPARKAQWSVQKREADWCNVCKTEPITGWLKEHDWTVDDPLNVDPDGNGQWDSSLAETLPTFVVKRDGVEVGRYAGTDKHAFRDLLYKLRGGTGLETEFDLTPRDAVIEGVKLTGVKRGETLVDYGSADGRILFEAAMVHHAKAIGVEIDGKRVAESRRLADSLQVSDLVSVRQEDATKSDVKGDVAYVYQNPALLAQLAPKLRQYRRVVSYMHEVPGMQGTRRGDFWVYENSQQSQPQQVMQPRYYAIYYGTKYYAPNGNCGCGMCNEIRRQIAAREHVEMVPVVVAQSSGCRSGCASAGCSNGGCSAGVSYSYGYSCGYGSRGDDDDDWDDDD